MELSDDMLFIIMPELFFFAMCFFFMVLCFMVVCFMGMELDDDIELDIIVLSWARAAGTATSMEAATAAAMIFIGGPFKPQNAASNNPLCSPRKQRRRSYN